ncbi:MAG: tetratricopeptide repeat protein [Pseudomonadota bacterium]
MTYQCVLPIVLPVTGQTGFTGRKILRGLACALILSLAAPSAAVAQSNGSAALQQRIEQLEQQVVDLQVVIGTLETIAQQGGGAARRTDGGVGGGTGGSTDTFVLETKVNALARQLQALTQEVRSARTGTTGPATPRAGVNTTNGAAVSAPVGSFAPATSGAPRLSAPRVGQSDGLASDWSADTAAATDWNAAPDGSGNTSGQASAAISGPAAPAQTGAAGAATTTAALTPGTDTSPEATQTFRSAYSLILGQKFDEAETAFEDFVSKHPQHQLAGNAQFWVGEARYRRGQYGEAARAFYKGFLTYDKSTKWHNSILKLAMSLSRSGERQAACKLLGDFDVKYTDAEANLRRTAKREMTRARCPGA